ncbi:MAG TPA: Spy/CpxP family protein refolding chaperone [Thermoanaerobaculia bacterium]|nr:Spy/CpxP family protein refolding chaperone [Thermoanaerobaculia bacterium]
MKKWLTLVAVLALVVPASLAARGGWGSDFGHGHRMWSHGDGPPPIADMLAKHLDLDAKQKASVQALADQMFATVKPLHEQLKGLHQDLEKALDANADAVTVGNLAISAHKLRAEAEAAHQEFHENVAKILNPAQKEKLDAMMAHMHHHDGPPDGAADDQ